jgi:hypothetical protein
MKQSYPDTTLTEDAAQHPKFLFVDSLRALRAFLVIVRVLPLLNP